MRTHLPDAHDWVRLPYRASSLDGQDGMVYRVETDIHTSAQDCWVSFEVAIPTYEAEPMVLFFNAIRSGGDSDEESTYVCNGLDGEWEVDEEDNGPFEQ